MKKAVAIVTLIVILLACISTAFADRYTDASGKIRIIKQYQEKYKNINVPGTNTTVYKGGCGLFSIAHAIQWVTNTKVSESEEYALIKRLVDMKLNTISSMTASLKTLCANDSRIVYHQGELNSSTLTESKVKSIFDSGGVIIANPVGHYVLGVGYRYYNSKFYIQIVDSSTYSTIEPRNDLNLHIGYKYNTMDQITGSQITGPSQYWISWDCFSGKCSHERNFRDWWWVSGKQGSSIQVSKITLNQTELSLNSGGTFSLTATISPDNATNKAINWTTSDNSVATVSDNGLITAVAIGTATITASATDGSGQLAVCNITVKPIADTLEFRDVAYPVNYGINSPKGYLLTSGTVVSDAELTSISSIIRDSNGNVISSLLDKSISGQSFSISTLDTFSSGDNGVKFSKIKSVGGNYTWTLIAKDKKDRTLRMVMYFDTVDSSSYGTATRSIAYPNQDPDPSGPVQSITITRNDGSEDDLGAFQVYKAVISPDNATNKNVAWTIGNEYIVENKDQGIDDAGAPFIILKNMHIDDTTLRATAQDGSGVSAEIPVTVSTNITRAEYYAGYYRGEDLDPDNMQLKTGDVFHVGVNWWWSYEPDTYDYQFVLEDTSGLEAYEDDSRHSGCFIAKKPGTWKVYLDFFENGQLIRDVDYTYVVHVSCAHASTEWQETKAPTCTEVGVKQLICDACGELLETQIIAMLEHVPGEWATVREATITEKGLKERRCARCGILLESEEIPVTACTHPSSTWVTVREATVDQDGLKERRCDVCGVVLESETIPKLAPEPPVATAQLTATATAMQADGTFTVTLGIKNNPGLGGMRLAYSFSGNQAAINSANCKGIGIADGVSVSAQEKISIAAVNPIIGDGDFLVLPFTAQDSKKDITITFICEKATNQAQATVNINNVSITVPATPNRVPGDVNGDGEADFIDAMLILQYDAGWSVNIKLSNGDVNGDSEVDFIDAMLILQYDAGWNVVLR